MHAYLYLPMCIYIHKYTPIHPYIYCDMCKYC